MPEPGETSAENAADEFFTTESTTEEVTKYVLHMQSTVNNKPISMSPVEAVKKPWHWMTRYRLEEMPKSPSVLQQVKRIQREQRDLYNRTVSSKFAERLRRLSRYKE